MDIHILVSLLNLKLRNEFDSLESLMNAFDLNKTDLVERLNQEGYQYHSSNNNIGQL